MLKKLSLYRRWLRIKRVNPVRDKLGCSVRDEVSNGVKAGRFIQVELPQFSRASEHAAGDNFPVLAGTLARAE